VAVAAFAALSFSFRTGSLILFGSGLVFSTKPRTGKIIIK
jgi:hypothetical protein